MTDFLRNKSKEDIVNMYEDFTAFAKALSYGIDHYDLGYSDKATQKSFEELYDMQDAGTLLAFWDQTKAKAEQEK